MFTEVSYDLPYIITGNYFIQPDLRISKVRSFEA